MNTQVGQGKANTGKPQYSGWVHLLLCGLLLALPAVAAAQNEPETIPDERAEQVEEISVSLPGSRQMALALAVPATRDQALLDVAAAAHLLQQARDRDDLDQAALTQTFLDDRGWLQRLVDRHGWVQPRGAVLDPAAWLVLEELQQHGLEDGPLTFPGDMPGDALLHQVFQRSGQRLAVVNLPALLLAIEADAITLWDEFLQLASPEGHAHAAWKTVETTWFSDRFESQVNEDEMEPVEAIGQAMSKLVLQSVTMSPPDDRLVVQLRYSLLNQAPALGQAEDAAGLRQLGDALYVVSLLDGLHDARHLEFVQGLLSLTASWLVGPAEEDREFSMPAWLATELPAISAQYASAFARTDPGLNDTMNAVYGVLQDIVSGLGSDEQDNGSYIEQAQTVLADAVARLALLIPDMVYYFDIPIRARIIEEINICISIAASHDQEDQPDMTRSQFDGCMDVLVRLAEQETRTLELSGNMDGPFTFDAMRRELGVPPWQRVNYGVGYLLERYSGNCQRPAIPLPNPLEWAVLATAMTWLAEHSPGFFYTEENEARVSRMRSIGEQLMLDLAAQSACVAAADAGGNDMISRATQEYEKALRELNQGISRAEQDFRASRLQTGADVSLAQDAAQRTAYRPDNLLIRPCNPEAVCDMGGELSTTRALIGLFPDEYLVADQTGMGRIEICYQNMEWVQRRSELVRPDDENVANYYGRLGFDLLGRYVENGQGSDIFGFRFTSPDEFHYLFAQTSEEILQDSCPTEWVGTRIVTPLRENRAGIVPDRLTYLASARNLPSRLLQHNWDQGAEWRDWFVTGLGVTPLDMPDAPDIANNLNQHLQSLYQAEQAEVYQRVFLPNARNADGEDVSLFDEISQVSINKALMRMQMMLFYPSLLLNSRAIRTAISGDAGLLDGRVLRRFREQEVALSTVNSVARERLDAFRQAWLKQPDVVRQQGSVSPSVAYAMTRMNELYRQFILARSEPLHEVEDTAEAQVQPEG